jgi:hypothetical protein
MRTRAWLGMVVLSLASVASSQVFTDRFDYPPGPLGPPWIADVGIWTATGTSVHTDPTNTMQYATLARTVCRDCVVECLVTYNPGGLTTITQRGGVVVRVQNAKSQDLWVAQVLNLAGGIPRDFNSVMIYEQVWRGTVQYVWRQFSQGRLRFTIVDSRMRLELDWDLDGRWDHALNQTVYQYLPLQYGTVGMFSSGGAFIDDFKLFDGVLIEAASAPAPQPGAVVPLALKGFPGAFHVAGASLGTDGFPMGPGRVPLRYDPLLILSVNEFLPSVFRDFRGRLDANGDGTIQVAVPPIPGLVGTTIYVAFVTHDGLGTILNYSNDYAITFQA